jgi:hypothetical protein
VPSAEKSVNFSYDMSLSSEDHVPKIVDNMVEDWISIAKVFHLIIKSNWCRRMELSNLVSVKTFHWNRLVLNYGPNRAAVVILTYSVQEKCYKLSFGKFLVG